MSTKLTTTDPATGARSEYVARVNRVVDYIDAHLHKRLTLAELAQVAHFSQFHFHRVFGALTGETLNQFVLRLRVERAAAILKTQPDKPITAIALGCGFSSSATFARSFKEAFSMTASEWRRGDGPSFEAHKSKISKQLSKACKAHVAVEAYADLHDPQPKWRLLMTDKLKATIEIQDAPEHRVAYVRHVGPYGQTAVVPKLFETLRTWAASRGLIQADSRFFCVAHDSPQITEQAKLRLSVCMTVADDTEVGGEVGAMTIAGGRCAVARFEIEPAQIADAWHAVIGGWLPQSGYQPDDRVCYEEVIESPRQRADGKIVLDIFVPVRPL